MLLSQLPLFLILSPFGGALAGAVQKPGLTLPDSAKANRDAAQKIFEVSYNAYRKYAWGHDDLLSVSGGYSDSRNGWGASIVDAMSTMHIMGLDDFFAEAVNFTTKINFSKSLTSSTVSVFETTIRYLGGLLSAYELSEQKYPILLQKATEVANKMAYAWVGSNEVPYGYLTFATNTPRTGNSNIAEAGTLALEWATLTKHTANQTYAKLGVGSLAHIARLTAPLPGLAAQGISPSTGKFVGAYVTWGGGSDSYFEYLIKYARLFNPSDNLYADAWKTAVDSSIKTLLRKSTVGGYTYLAEYDDSKTIRHVSSHLACFHGGNWLLGGKLLNNDTIVQIALDLVDGCWNTYASTYTGIGPESFGFISSSGDYTGDTVTTSQRAFHAKHGFYVRDADYILRPEVLESNFYAYRVTGDQKYLDRAASAIKAFNEHLANNLAFAGISGVDQADYQMWDDMESFWFAEVLKYLYLTFDDPNHISLDEWVFNTEAHPFRAPTPKTTYGSGKLLQQDAPFRTQDVGAELPEVSPGPLTRSRKGKKVPPSA